jgi:hypothetical protein
MKYALFALLALVATPAMAAVNLSLQGLLQFVITLVIVALIFWCIWWFLGYVGVPEPFNKVLRVIIGLVALVVVLNLLFGLMGTPLFAFH